MINRTILNYTLRYPLGEGGMATVYYAENPIGKKAAVKVLNQDLFHNADMRARFQQEARVMVGLEHRHIRQVYDLYESDDTLAIVMEYLEGDDLGQWVATRGKVPLNQAIQWTRQALGAIQHAHEAGVIHRDLKPSNLFLTTKNEIKVLDFGIARLASADLHLTRTDTRMGSPMYMSPEQIRTPKDISLLTDIYSLGVTLHALLSGKRPYDTATDSEYDLQILIVTEPLKPIPGFPKPLQLVIDKATAKNPRDRFASADAFAKALSLPVSDLDEKTLLEEKPIAPEKKKTSKPKGQAKPKPEPEETHETEELSTDLTLDDLKRVRRNRILSALGVVLFFVVTGLLKGWFSFGENEYQVIQAYDQYGYTDGNGTVVISPQFDDAKPFEGDRAKVKQGDRWFYIDRKGNFLENYLVAIPSKTDSTVTYRSAAMAALQAQDPPATKPANSGTSIYESLTFEGKPATPPAESRLEALRLQAKTADFSYIGPFGPTGLAEVKDKSTGLFGVVNQNMKYVVACTYLGLKVCDNGMMVAWKEANKLGYLNKSGTPVTEFQYFRAGCFSGGYAAFKKGLFWGYIDEKGNEALAPIYMDAGDFQQGKALVKALGGQSFYINSQGKCIENCP